MVDHLAARLRGHELRARTVELKVRSSDFRTRMRSQSLPEATDVTAELWTAARMLFDSTRWADLLPVRLLGVGVSRLTRQAATQGDLFAQASHQRHSALDRTVDAIRNQFGAAAIQRGCRVEQPDDSPADD